MCSRSVPITRDMSLAEEGIQDRIYRDKLSHLEAQLDELERGQHPEYMAQMEQLKQRLRVRQEYNEAVRGLEIELGHKWCEREERAAVEEYEGKKQDLLNSMLAELEEKRKQVEAEYHTMDLNSDCSDLKPTSTRKLRRRPNEPPPNNDKRARKTSPTLSFQLNDNDIGDDLALIQAGTKTINEPSSIKTNGNDTRPLSRTVLQERIVISSPDPNAHMDSNRLMYADKCYVKNQSVIVETSDLGKWTGVINNISHKEMTLRSLTDSSMIVITVHELRQGRAIVRKKSGQQN